MIKELIRLADHLDKIGRVKEANYVDLIIKKSFLDTFEGGGGGSSENYLLFLDDQGTYGSAEDGFLIVVNDDLEKKIVEANGQLDELDQVPEKIWVADLYNFWKENSGRV